MVITESKPIETRFKRNKEEELKSLAESQKRIDNILNLSIELQQRKDAPTIWEIIWKVVKSTPQMIKLIILILNFKDNFMQDMKTTITSIVQALLVLVGVFGVTITPEHKEIILQSIGTLFALVTIIKGYFTKDKI